MLADAIAFLAVVAAGHVLVSWLSAAHRGDLARTRGWIERPVPRRRPSVSVIVPAWNDASSLAQCLRSLESVEYDDWEVIVVAGGNDGSYDVALVAATRLPRARVLAQTPRGKNAALNDGLSIATGDVIAILDADSEVSPDWLDALVAPIGQDVVATTGAPVPFRATVVSAAEQMDLIRSRRIEGSPSLNGAGSIAVTRSAIERIGGFPEDVLVGVDWDLDVRLAAAGLNRSFSPQALVRTERPSTIGEFWRNELRWRRAHFASLLHHADYFLSGWHRSVESLYVYALAWAALLLSALAGASILAGETGPRSAVLSVWGVFVMWLALRSLANPIAVSVYCRDIAWLKVAWVSPLLLFVTLSAIVPATLTVSRRDAHFKGPRTARSVDHGG